MESAETNPPESKFKVNQIILIYFSFESVDGSNPKIQWFNLNALLCNTQKGESKISGHLILISKPKFLIAIIIENKTLWFLNFF